MNGVFQVLTILSGLLFLWYGGSTLFANGMADDFERFGLGPYRRLTGGLEMLGALGLFAGLLIRPVIVISAAGLALMMLLGVFTRVRVRDPWSSLAPGILLLILNTWLAVYALATSPIARGTL
jgi:uncharacterized membrane protein YphA (DoxX/SURF4 family)